MRYLFLAWLAGLLVCRLAHSQDLTKALDSPLSPGSVALLVSHASEPAVRERWAAALKDPRPEVRAAAARVINVSGAAPLVEDLKRALATEMEWYAASEEMCALAVLGGRDADEILLAAAGRLGEMGAGQAAECIARARGPDALPSLPALRRAGLNRYDDFLSWATRGGTQNLTAAGSMAIRDGVTAEWTAVLALARRPGAVLDPGVLLAAIFGTDDAIRAATFWHLALVKARGGALDERVVGPVKAALDAERPKDLVVGLPLELLGRALGRKAVELDDWIAALAKERAGAPYALEFGKHPALLETLRTKEIEALSTATRGDPKALQKSPRHQWPALTFRERESSVSTVDGFPRGYVASVLEVAGCDLRAAHGVAAAQVAYGPDGRPRQMAMVDPGHSKPLGGPPACEEAARVLLISAIGENSRPAPPKTLLVLLQEDALSCLAEQRPAQPREVSPEQSPDGPATKSGIQAPRKLRNVSPQYPPSAIDLKVDGLVVLEAVISPTGCVRSLDVVQGIPTLNWEAMRAVSQWRYTPTLLNGIPVPVIMTVSVNFKLGRR